MGGQKGGGVEKYKLKVILWPEGEILKLDWFELDEERQIYKKISLT